MSNRIKFSADSHVYIVQNGYAWHSSNRVKRKLKHFVKQVVSEFLKSKGGEYFVHNVIGDIYWHWDVGCNHIIVFTRVDETDEADRPSYVKTTSTLTIPFEVFISNDIRSYVKDMCCRRNALHFKYCAKFATSTSCSDCKKAICDRKLSVLPHSRFTVRRFDAETQYDM